MSEQRIEIGGMVYTVGRGYEPKPEDVERLNAALAALPRQNWMTLPKATHLGYPIAAERIEPGDRLTISGGRAYLADRDEAARRAAVERAIARHLPPDDDDAPPAAAGDVSPAPGCDGAAQHCPQCGRSPDVYGCRVLDSRYSICRSPLTTDDDGPAQHCSQCGCTPDVYGCAVLDARRSICRSTVTTRGDVSPGDGDDGADAAIVARGKP